MPSPPIVLAHGYLGFRALGPLDYFNKVAQVLTAVGAKEIYTAEVPPKGSIADRSSQFAEQIRQHVPNGKVHLIAHSMGGLDARFLIGQANGGEMIATLTTLGTPFRGTLAADIALDPLKLNGIGAGQLLAAIARYEIRMAMQWPFAALGQARFAVSELRDAVEHLATGDYSRITSYLTGLFSLPDAALRELTTDNCTRLFRDDEQDLQGVPAFSYAGSVEPASASPFLCVPALLMEAAGEPNDGMVPLSSARLRNHRETLSVDHLGLIGWGPTDVSECYRRIYAALPK